MALDKLVDSSKLDAALNYEANRILAKTGGSQAISFDLENEKGFGDIIDTITGGGEVVIYGISQDSEGYLVLDSGTVGPSGSITVTDNGMYSVSSYASVEVAIPLASGVSF